MKTISEEFLSNINANIFLREFSFSENEFNPTPGKEVEFADHVVWIDNIMFVFQVKERHEPEYASDDTERKWFQKKVVEKGIRQIRDTLEYFETQNNIVITNQRGHKFSLQKNQIIDVVKIITYAPSKLLPSDCLNIKSQISSTAGFVHIIPLQDYVVVCRTFVTPAEITEYLNFREKISREFTEVVKSVSESALIGQFLYGNFQEGPDYRYKIFHETLLRNSAESGVFFILHNFQDHIVKSNSKENETEYYRILIEFAKLAGYELREIEERISLSLRACENENNQIPYRTVSVNTGCGFVFIPIMKEFVQFRQIAIENITKLAKYDQKLDRCVGVTFAKDGSDYLIDWAITEYPWNEDKEMDNQLRNYPFRELKQENFHRYYFSENVFDT